MVGPLLSRDDLDELSEAAAAAEEPAAVAADLAEAARAGRLADPTDAGYAYLLAAEIHERADDLASALALVEHALSAYRAADHRQLGQVRAHRARLLLQLGREGQAMAELTELRALMVTDPQAAAYVPEALEAGGRAEIALKWLTEALAGPTGPTGPTGAGIGRRVAGQLAAVQDRIRSGVEPAADPYQDGADLDGDSDGDFDDDPGTDLDGDLDDDFDQALAEDLYQGGSYQLGGDGDGDAVLLVWPREAYDVVDQRWPEVLEPTGAESWEEYRRYCQAAIASWSRRSRAPLYQVTGDAEEFEEWLADQGVDPYSANLVALARWYGNHLAEQGDLTELPPGRDEPCWCGSGVSYGRCCLHLS